LIGITNVGEIHIFIAITSLCVIYVAEDCSRICSDSYSLAESALGADELGPCAEPRALSQLSTRLKQVCLQYLISILFIWSMISDECH